MVHLVQHMGLCCDEYAWNHTRPSRFRYTSPCRSGHLHRSTFWGKKKNPDPKQHGSRGADGRGGWRAERPAGISWRGDGDRHARYQALFASLGSQQGVKTKVCIQRGILLFCAKYSWMWAAPNSRHIFGRKTAFLGIWQSWWLTAVGALIIHSLCWFSF